MAVGKYLDMLQRHEAHQSYDKNDIDDKRLNRSCDPRADSNQQYTFSRINRFCRTFRELERRCPDLVESVRWQAAVEDGRRFLAKWGEQAQQLGWTARDLFGLHKPPENPHASYRRLSRYDETGLIWLLEGREVTALTADTSAIRSSSGSVTVYRKHNKPALGPLGDSTDDFTRGGHE
jgi:hypothetical protein